MNTGWLSREWFTPETLMGFHWAQPWYLYGLAIIPLLYFLKWFGSAKSTISLPFLLPENNSDSFRWVTLLRYFIPLFFTLGLVIALLALARPQRTFASEDRVPEGLNLILAIDVSESMNATDILPTRLEAAKQVAFDFLTNRQSDRIGLVVFAGEAFSLCPLTTDYTILQSYTRLIYPELVKTSGTAIGNALAMGINRLRDIPGQNKAIILLSDGDNTAGNLPPEMAAELAKSFGIRIYTIALGDAEGTEFDRDVLREVADVGEGHFFDVYSSDTLQHVFDEIEKTEQSRLMDYYRKEYTDYYQIYLNWALVFFLIALLLRVSPLGNILQD
jgi:Ca-activated chloride channel family protein